MVSLAPCIVFLGPSLPVAEARALYADAEYRPPIRRGDLDGLAPGTVVGMIDGVFDQELSVSQREVWNALLRGIHIMGSSSMGAMRAAEVRGVQGVGRVYDMFKRGIIERDDEVALIFDPHTYRTVSEPLVNVRYAVERLVSSGTLPRDKGRRIVAAARALHYRDRDYRRILREAGLADAEDGAELLSLLRRHDLKREDAKLLLEQLPSFCAEARSAQPRKDDRAPVYEVAEYRDELSTRTVQGRMPVDSNVLVWEYGDELSFSELVRFLKLTGAFKPHLRAALSRFVLQGNSLEPPEGPPPQTRQHLLVELMAQWGWYSAEEARVTLIDLGLGLESLLERLDEEAAARAAEQQLLRTEPPELLEALRAELVIDDLALKRAALRLGSFKHFVEESRILRSPLTSEQRQSARRALCQVHGELQWSVLLVALAELGIGSDEVERFAEDLAHARRAGREVLLAMAGKHPAEVQSKPAVKPRKRGAERQKPTAMDVARLVLKKSPKAPGSPRFCVSLKEGEKLATSVALSVGITRVALVGELDELSVQVSQAYRPDSPWSTTAGSGKSETRAGARIGGVLEEAEKFAQERFARVDATASYAALRARGAAVVDPRALDLPYDSRYHPDLELDWTLCHDLLADGPCFVPAALVISDRQKNDILYSARLGEKIFSSSGLASGFTLEEALTHALCEVIERHALRLAELDTSNPGTPFPAAYRFVDLDTAPPSVRRLAGKLTAPGHSLRVLDITSDVKVATFEARLYSFDSLKPFSATGTATHPNAEVAMHMALLEAAQSKIGTISGSREDLTIAARSLGRHERPRPFRNACEARWYGEDAPFKPFSAALSAAHRDARDDVRYVLERLRAAGVGQALAVDYTLPELRPMRAVRVLLPGLESANQFYTGPRARALAIADLLPRPRFEGVSHR
jgi:ribosomal protein S12 methylthiotransferase accessory factor